MQDQQDHWNFHEAGKIEGKKVKIFRTLAFGSIWCKQCKLKLPHKKGIEGKGFRGDDEEKKKRERPREDWRENKRHRPKKGNGLSGKFHQ